MAKITGIGKVFFKSRGDHKALAAWYQRHLGLTLEPRGGAILRRPEDKGDDKGQTVWSVAEKDSRGVSHGRFAWILDPDGNTAELWETAQ